MRRWIVYISHLAHTRSERTCKMPYKIVKTLEKGKYMHWIAPSQWEKNNIVKWPKKNASKLVRSADSLPQPDWLDIMCQVKRRNILTFEEAERELDSLLGMTDTDDETVIQKIQQTEEVNLNVLVEQLYTDADHLDPSVSPETHNEPQNVSSAVVVANDTTPSSQIVFTSPNNEILGTFCVMNESCSNIPDAIEESSTINNTLNAISLALQQQNKMITTISDNQKKIMQKMASISVQIDTIQLQLHDHNATEVVSLGASKFRSENKPINVAPINNIEELKKTEQLLSEKTAREQLKQTYSILCSGGKGINCAYTLIDIMFTRDFLCQCSWSGSSRSDGIKISLKCYKNIVSFFWEMILFWDCTFTLKQNEEFFKSVLKNANKRKNAKLERASTARKRVKLGTINKNDKPGVEKEQRAENNNIENVASSSADLHSESIENDKLEGEEKENIAEGKNENTENFARMEDDSVIVSNEKNITVNTAAAHKAQNDSTNMKVVTEDVISYFS